jgi:predicted ferric reductase
MKRKGLWIVLISLIATMGIWLGSKWHFGELSLDNLKFIAKVSGIFSIMLFSWSMILSARFYAIEKWFGGLDKVYTTHKWLGIIGFFLVLLHPVFLAFRTTNILGCFGLHAFDTLYNVGFNIGLIALFLLIGLILMIRNKQIPYHIWKKSHEFMTVFYAFAVLHSLFVTADIYKYPALGAWMYLWFSFGLYCGIYKKFIYPIIGPHFDYSISKIETRADAVQLTLSPLNKQMKYNPGQFLFAAFSNTYFKGEYHPYSIASAPNLNGSITLGIKNLGDDTSNISRLCIGDAVKILGPYGNTGEKYLRDDKDCVCIGGGIGITPFLGIWDDAQKSSARKYKTHVFYSVKSEEEAIFDNDFNQNKPLNSANTYNLHSVDKTGFLTVKIIESQIGNLNGKYFLLCGPEQMTSNLINQLKKSGVTNSQIILEDFNMRDIKIPSIFEILGKNS